MMSVIRKPGPVLCSAVLVAFVGWILEDTASAAERYPQYVTIKTEVTGKFFVERAGDQTVPVKLQIGGHTFDVSKENGRFGVRVRSRDMARAVPEFGEKLALATANLGVYRVQQLIGGDSEVARTISEMKLGRSSSRQGGSAAGGGGAAGQAAAEQVDPALKNQYVQSLQSACENLMNSEAFFFPEEQWPPGPRGSRGGWAFVGEDEDEEAGRTESASSGDPEAAREGAPSGSMGDQDHWWTSLLGFVLIVVILIAPVAAAMWAITQPFTFATVLSSFAGALGAVTATSLVVTALDTALDLLAGDPFIQILDGPDWSGLQPDGSYAY